MGTEAVHRDIREKRGQPLSSMWWEKTEGKRRAAIRASVANLWKIGLVTYLLTAAPSFHSSHSVRNSATLIQASNQASNSRPPHDSLYIMYVYMSMRENAFPTHPINSLVPHLQSPSLNLVPLFEHSSGRLPAPVQTNRKDFQRQVPIEGFDSTMLLDLPIKTNTKSAIDLNQN